MGNLRSSTDRLGRETVFEYSFAFGAPGNYRLDSETWVNAGYSITTTYDDEYAFRVAQITDGQNFDYEYGYFNSDQSLVKTVTDNIGISNGTDSFFELNYQYDWLRRRSTTTSTLQVETQNGGSTGTGGGGFGGGGFGGGGGGVGSNGPDSPTIETFSYQTDYLYDRFHRVRQITQSDDDQPDLAVGIDWYADSTLRRVNRYETDSTINGQVWLAPDGTGINPFHESVYEYDWLVAGRVTSIAHSDLTSSGAGPGDGGSGGGTGRGGPGGSGPGSGGSSGSGNTGGSSGSAGTFTYEWEFDDAGRIISQTLPTDTVEYGYDQTDQLTDVTTTAGNLPDQNWEYDLNGNREYDVPWDQGDYNQLKYQPTEDGVLIYSYDHEGNRTRRYDYESNPLGGFTLREQVNYEWDFRNRLTSVQFFSDAGQTLTKRVDYTYDAFDRRLTKRVDANGDGTTDTNQRFLYDTNVGDPSFAEVVMIIDGDDFSPEKRYLHGPMVDQVFAEVSMDNTSGDPDVLWMLTDHQGSVRDVLEYDQANNSTDLVSHLTYDAFGTLVENDNPTTATRNDGAYDAQFAYTGREWDADAELYYYRARWYDPNVGQFVSEDPIGFAAGDTNLRRYVGNRPAELTDPSGLSPNQLNAETIERLVKFVRTLEKIHPEENSAQIMDRLLIWFKRNTWIYIYTRQGGWIDVPHFIEAATWTNSGVPILAVEATGFCVEGIQSSYGPDAKNLKKRTRAQHYRNKSLNFYLRGSQSMHALSTTELSSTGRRVPGALKTSCRIITVLYLEQPLITTSVCQSKLKCSLKST